LLAVSAPLQAGARRMMRAWPVLLLEALVAGALLRDRWKRRHAASGLEQRLRSERLLSDVSARLIPASVRDIDVEIVGALERVVKFLGIDRATLFQPAEGPSTTRLSWAAAGVPERPPPMDEPELPWTLARLRQGHVVQFSRLADLPPEATRDRATYDRHGTRSSLALPLHAGPSALGVLAFERVLCDGAWPAEIARWLRRLGEVFAGALERRRLELMLAERLRFETLLSELSATLGRTLPAEIDGEIDRALRRLADFFKTDWGRLTELSHDARNARVTHAWTASGTLPAPPAIAPADMPWAIARLEAGEVVRFSRLDELPADAAARDRLTYGALGIRSQVEVPLRSGGVLLGTLAFAALGAERVWPDDLTQRLQLLGDVFASILARRRSDLETQRLQRDLSHVGRVSTMGALTASLAHELNQPLTAMLSNAEAAQDLLESAPIDLDEVRAILADIVADDKRASGVIHQLRRLLRKDTPPFTALDVGEMVGEVARLVSGDAALRGVTIDLDLGAALPPVRGDRVQLQQVVLNLVLNGLDAMRDAPAARRAPAVAPRRVPRARV
jgi:GAF domain-containing protein